ncbi:Phenylacetate-coenzyme A ligase PaaK, adenylate-forming domain family [Amycolatopsis xylanica]|uniref:Phenylacetate-coenzyme A ligase PaaK, adenylate-forming domain family n=1 Tax=Amycolatopsis xylanica TaxID=589385 RepID=A0A1H3QFP3_9PSEU|nr:acyl-CoA reductase [Amycolatopsis xylanica]SDZ11835.1 Phenylacetate-coenzyme A ligase PaaK, adenylate-forming domain family [Amycolatopsis xylanica]
MSNEHYWQGTWVDDVRAGDLLETLEETTQRVLGAERLSPLTVLAACEKLADRLSKPDSVVRIQLTERLQDWGLPREEIAETFDLLVDQLAREELERKVTRELGGVDPARLARFDFKLPIFEAWVPVGLLAHVAAGNAPAVGALSAIEGLLTGNLNVIKTSGADSLFTAEFLAALAEQDPTGKIAERLIVLRFSSSRKEWLERMVAPADAVAVWGGEEAISGIAEFTGPGTRLIDWGPKLSFAYLTADTWSATDALHAVAADVCRLDQQACSSPQVIYLDTDDEEEVFAFAERFAPVLAEVVRERQPRDPSDAEWAEINNTVIVAKLEENLGLTKVLTAEDGTWRVMADTRSALRASPLYRTVWVKPLPRNEITATLRPMRRYLQTVGLAATRQDTAVLARTLVSTGVQRVTVPGRMLGGYAGEPHDGVYAMQRYSRRVDVQLDERFATDAALDDFTLGAQLPAPNVPVTPKSEFETLRAGRGEVFFLSGGSTGKPKLSKFSWADYDEISNFASEALLATGIDPRTDRVMNLFFSGHMYGSFVSYFSALERLGAVQFPMGGEWDRFEAIAQSIVDNQIDTLVTVPSFVMRLFTEGGDTLRRYQGVRKIFYAGEHFGDSQIQWLREEFGVEIVRSAAYGGIDAGPMGYQCLESPARVHHMFPGLHTLEILDTESDTPVAPGEVGRLVFTAHTRRGQRVDRYEIGDLGRWITEPCGCGRQSPRFELLGRVGDVFRTAAVTLNYRRFVAIAADAFGYSGAFQVVLSEDAQGDILTMRLESGDPDTVTREFIARYPELTEAVEGTRLLRLHTEIAPQSAFAKTASSGKLIAVVENRSSRSTS